MRLFTGGLVEQYYERLRLCLEQEVGALPEAAVDQAPPGQLAGSLTAPHLPVCPTLGDDFQIDPPLPDSGNENVRINIHIPYTGTPELFQYRGDEGPRLDVDFEVRAKELVAHWVAPPIRGEDAAKRLHADVTAFVKKIRDDVLPSLCRHAQAQNKRLLEFVERKIQERQGQIRQHAKRLAHLEGAGFKLHRRDDGSEGLIIPVKPKPIAVRAGASAPLTPTDPELSIQDYNEILGMIRRMATVYERSPSVFKEMDEEDLRMILLVGLNGLFEGQATGETFNKEGKTDILIRHDNSNIFIAECLIWDGPEHFKTKLTGQLFNYSAWRDSKLAAVVFNRRKNFTSVVAKMRDTAGQLDNCLSQMDCPFSDACRHRFRRTDDPQRQFILTCLAFEVPS